MGECRATGQSGVFALHAAGKPRETRVSEPQHCRRGSARSPASCFRLRNCRWLLRAVRERRDGGVTGQPGEPRGNGNPPNQATDLSSAISFFGRFQIHFLLRDDVFTWWVKHFRKIALTSYFLAMSVKRWYEELSSATCFYSVVKSGSNCFVEAKIILNLKVYCEHFRVIRHLIKH